MSEINCAACGETFAEEELVYSAAGKICQVCELDQSAGGGFGQGQTLPQIMAVLFSVAPFLGRYVTGDGFTRFSVGLHTNLTTAGQDHVAFFGGLMAVGAGVYLLKKSMPSKEKKGLALGGLALVVGLLNVVLRSGYLI